MYCIVRNEATQGQSLLDLPSDLSDDLTTRTRITKASTGAGNDKFEAPAFQGGVYFVTPTQHVTPAEAHPNHHTCHIYDAVNERAVAIGDGPHDPDWPWLIFLPISSLYRMKRAICISLGIRTGHPALICYTFGNNGRTLSCNRVHILLATEHHKKISRSSHFQCLANQLPAPYQLSPCFGTRDLVAPCRICPPTRPSLNPIIHLPHRHHPA